MSISQQQLEENCICEIEKDNLDKFKKILSSGFNINSFLRSKKEYWVSFGLNKLKFYQFNLIYKRIQIRFQLLVNH
jgi:hypothetical protein